LELADQAAGVMAEVRDRLQPEQPIPVAVVAADIKVVHQVQDLAGLRAAQAS
jgi:hypothetical protein